MVTRAKKPAVPAEKPPKKTNSFGISCCGECYFFHVIKPENIEKCFVRPPVFTGFDENGDPVTARGAECLATAPACECFKPRTEN